MNIKKKGGFTKFLIMKQDSFGPNVGQTNIT